MRLRVTALFLGALLLAATPAMAQTQTYVGASEAVGFELSFGGEGLIIGQTEAGVQSGGDQACDEGEVGCAFAEALLGFSGAAEASQPEGEESAAVAAGEFPVEELMVATFGVAEAAASGPPEPGGQGRAAATQVALTLTETLFDEDALGPVRDEIKDGIDQILDPISENDPSGEVGPRLKGLVDFVFDNLGNAPLATIEIGPTNSLTSHAEGVTTARATASGAVVTLAPPPAGTEFAELAPDGLAQIVVGESVAAVSTDGETGSVDETFASAVTLRIFDPGTQEYQEIPIEGSEQQCSPEELAPLIICATLAGETERVEEGAGAAAGTAAVEITIFDGEEVDQLRLAGAASAAAVNAAVPEPPEPEPRPDLPRTGGDFFLPALALLGAGTLTAGAAVRRSRR